MNMVVYVCLETTWLKKGLIVLVPFDIITTHDKMNICIFGADVHHCFLHVFLRYLGFSEIPQGAEQGALG